MVNFLQGILNECTVTNYMLFVLVLIICINIFAFAPNLHISQMTSLASKL